jgi:microcompartment protein CcmL/EutN
MVQIPYGGVLGGVVTQHAAMVGRNVEEVGRNVEQVANEHGEPVESAVIPRKHGGHVVTAAPEEQEEQEEQEGQEEQKEQEEQEEQEEPVAPGCGHAT